MRLYADFYKRMRLCTAIFIKKNSKNRKYPLIGACAYMRGNRVAVN